MLLLAVAGILPSGFESTDPAYIGYHIFFALLIIATGFQPLITGFGGLVGHLAFAAQFPEFLSPFQTVIAAALTVTVSYLRLHQAVLFSALLLATHLIAMFDDSQRGTVESIGTLVFTWAFAALMGGVAANFELRMQQEIARREEAAREHERALERLRLDLALDTHDTVSHGLAVEAGIVRILGADARSSGLVDPRLTELALVNSHTQQQLRVLLSRMTRAPGALSRCDDYPGDMVRAADMIRSATESSGYDIVIDFQDLPHSVTGEELEASLFILKELATNMVKHASATGPCSITMTGSLDSLPGSICFSARNPCLDTPSSAPHSLLARTRRLGGSFSTSYARGVLTTTVEIPANRKVMS